LKQFNTSRHLFVPQTPVCRIFSLLLCCPGLEAGRFTLPPADYLRTRKCSMKTKPCSWELVLYP